MDADGAPSQVQVVPSEGQRLAAPQAEADQDQPEGSQSRSLGRPQQSPHFGGAQRGGRALLAAGRLHEQGHVARDEFVTDGV